MRQTMQRSAAVVAVLAMLSGCARNAQWVDATGINRGNDQFQIDYAQCQDLHDAKVRDAQANSGCVDQRCAGMAGILAGLLSASGPEDNCLVAHGWKKLPVKSAASSAQSINQAQSSTENLFARFPDGWYTLPATYQGNVTTAQLLPPGGSPQDYSESIVVQRQDGEKKPPKDYVQSVVDGSRANCEGIVSSPVDEHPNNGYKAAEVRFACNRSSRTGKSGLMMVKAIAGRDALHVVQRVWLGPPVDVGQPIPVPLAVVSAWDSFDRSVSVCDSRELAHSCDSVDATRAASITSTGLPAK